MWAASAGDVHVGVDAAQDLPVLDGAVTADFRKSREVDSFATVVVGGRALTITRTPRDARIRGGLKVVGPDRRVIAKAAAPKRGEEVTLTLPAGTVRDVTLRAQSLAGRGAYELAAVEETPSEDERPGAPSNDTVAAAESLDATALRRPGGATERMQVLGASERNAAADVYSFQLEVGQRASVALTGTVGRFTSLQLLDPSGNGVAEGRGGDRPDDQAGLRIDDFVAPAKGRYHARVTGPADERYELTVDRTLPVTLAADATPPGADLAVTGTTVPATLQVGSWFDASWTVTNQGTAEAVANESWDGLYFSADPLLDPSDVLSDYFYHDNIPPLAAGASYDASDSFYVPAEAAGLGYILVAADHYFDNDVSYSIVSESDEGNNVAVVPVQVMTPDVDLTVSSATVPASGVLGESVDVSWTATNLGADAADLGWYERFFISDDETLDPDDEQINDAFFGGSLGAAKATSAVRR